VICHCKQRDCVLGGYVDVTHVLSELHMHSRKSKRERAPTMKRSRSVNTPSGSGYCSSMRLWLLSFQSPVSNLTKHQCTVEYNIVVI
jgi:hypothetical protein